MTCMLVTGSSASYLPVASTIGGNIGVVLQNTVNWTLGGTISMYLTGTYRST
jgi:hypothetical protein